MRDLKLGVPQTHDDTLVTAEDTTATIAALADTDGSETLSVAISALPIGAILTDSAYRFTATSRETANGVTATTTIGLAVVVLPVDDAPLPVCAGGASSCAPPCPRAITTRSPSARPPYTEQDAWIADFLGLPREHSSAWRSRRGW